MPEPQGEPVSIHVFDYLDDSGDKVTRQSQTGVLILSIGHQSYGSVRSRTRFILLHLIRDLKQ